MSFMILSHMMKLIISPHKYIAKLTKLMTWYKN